MTTVYEIKNRLLRVIDEDGSVLNLPAVMDIVTLLENTRITRDELEDTRIGKYINDVRRAAKDLSLQKRAKKLIKSWQQMIANASQMTQQQQTASNHSVNSPSLKRPQSSPALSSGAKNNKRVPSLNNVNGGAKPSIPSSKKQALVQKETFSKKESKTIKLNPKTKTTFPKSKSAQNLSNTSQSSFTCKPNGLKMTFTTLSSTTSTNPTVSSSTVTSSERLKRKRKEEGDETKVFSLHRTSIVDVTSSPRTHAKRKDRDESNTALPNKYNNTNNCSATERTNIFKSSPPSVAKAQVRFGNFAKDISSTPRLVDDGEVGNAILPQYVSHKYGNEQAGVDGCRSNDGSWHSWSDGFVLRRPLGLPAASEEPVDDLLSILPYVELD